MPTSDGRFKGISLPTIPWHKDPEDRDWKKIRESAIVIKSNETRPRAAQE